MAGLLTHGWSRVAVLAGTVCALLAALLVAPAAAEHYEDVREVSAGDGVAAAAAYSKLAFPTGAANALLGRADVFADSLASGVLQEDRPLLLTNNYNLSAPTKDELARLEVGTVTILGGLSAVSSGVEQELKDLGYRVNRLNGPSRIETAIEVAKASSPGRTALLARGFGSADPTSAFADSLAAGGWAAEKDLPILLTESEKLSQPTADFLRGRIDQLFVVGGRAAISDAVVTQARALGVAVTRVSGTNRFETAVAIAKARGFATAANASEVVLVDGQGDKAWTDGFAVAAYAGRNKAPVVLANSAASGLPAATSTFLNAGPQADLLAGWTVPAAQVTQAAEGMDKDAVTTRVMQVALHGDNVVRVGSSGEPTLWGHGVRGKTGTLTMTIDEETNSIDYTFESQLTGPYAPLTPDSSGLVIRKAPLDARGLVAMVRFPEPKSTGQTTGTVTRTSYATGFHVRELIQNPAAFYAEAATDTETYRNGAIRGQLPSGGTSHLPGKPTFSAIQTSAGDNWITLKFAAPVFTNKTVSLKDGSSDFTVTVDNGVPVDLETATHDIPTTAAGAKDTFILKLPSAAGSPVPVQNKETVVTITQAGAAKLMNNLGDLVAVAPVTLKQITPADTTPPQFTGVDAGANSDVLHLDFSEPVHHGALTAGSGTAYNSRDIQVQFVGSGGSLTQVAATTDLASRDLTNRSRRLSLTLAQPVPAGNEVRVTLANKAVSTSDPAAIKDAAGLRLTGAFTRTVVAAARGGFTDVSVTDVVAGQADNQVQQVVFRLVEPLPAGQTITVVTPGTASQITYGQPTSVASTPLVNGLEMEPLNNNTAVLTATNGIPSGTLVTVTLSDVDVTTTAESPANGQPSLKMRISRRDTGTVAEPTFDRRRGVANSSAAGGTDVIAGKLNWPQTITMTVRGATLAKNGVISLDLRELTSNGVTYPVSGTKTVSALSGANPRTVTADFVGGARDRVDITVTDANGLAVGDVVTLTLGADAAGTAPYATRLIRVTRTDPAGERAALNVVPAVVKPSLETFTAGDMGYAAGQVQELSVKLLGDLRAGSVVTFSLPNPLTAPQTGSGVPRIVYSSSVGDIVRVGPDTTGTLLLTQGNPTTVTFTVPAGSTIASGTTLTVQASNIDTRRALKPSMTATVSRSDGTGTLTDPYAVTGAPENTIESITFTGTGANFGDDPNESLTVVFTTAPTVNPAGDAASSLTIDGSPAFPLIRCGDRVVCSATNTDGTPGGRIVTIRVTTPFQNSETPPQSSAITNIACRTVATIANWGSGTSAPSVAPSFVKVGPCP